MYLGVDIGGTEVKIGFFDEKLNLLLTENFVVNFDAYKTPILKTVKKSIVEFVSENNIDISTVKGIGVSATGQIDVNTGVVIGSGGHIANWLGSEIKKEISELYNIKTTVINDGNAMILGEAFVRGENAPKNIIGITVGTGIGGGIVVNSKLLLGRNGIAGEVGHISILADGKLCTCGNRGCYEEVASTSALVRMVKSEFDSLDIKNFDIDSVNGKNIFKEIEDGNKKLSMLVDKWVSFVASGIVSLVHTFNPDMVLVGGGVSAQEEIFIKPLKAYIEKYTMPRFFEGLIIESALLKNTAGMIGAISYNINN